MPNRLLIFSVCVSIVALVPATIPCRAQERNIPRKDVPAAVLSAFAQSYPHAKIRGTSTEVEKGKTYYEIESIDGTQARDILYLPDGTASEVEEVVSAESLPEPVKAAVAHEFPKAKIVKAERVTKGADRSYEIHVAAGAKKGSLVVSPAGAVLGKDPLKAKTGKSAEEEKEEDEEGEDD